MKKCFVIIALCSTLLLSGCFKMGEKLPPTTSYMLSINYPAKAKQLLTKNTLAVESVSAISPFGGDLFIYRTTQTVFLADYFHLFLVAPNEQITNILTQYLTQKRLFENVTSMGSSDARPDYILNGVLLALYADYRQSRRPQAVMRIRFTLYHTPDQLMKFDHVFSARIPLSAKTNQALVAAWNQGLSQILSQLYARMYPLVLH